ncbi:Protoheme IX farnesyltransferase 1 [Gimesia panareensis]|uniref:Protoheme IX farnesyltransferase n=1 Tax=Gimesia panareensis TaxID=2527978 RepID=A0A518FPG2_9PLAN|nr:heme o synthase [Gimesia panareensis]QDV18236.1 Protoheme IX farnesyltransferase 1 [Gimesia panareensis]
MSTTQQSYIAVEESKTAARPISLARLADYLELTKPRISTMALISVALGYTLGSAHSWSLLPLVHALLGIGLVAVGCNSLNQLLEIKSDKLMPRTTGRPLPSGRLSVSEVLVFGILCALAGIFYLAMMVNLLTAFLSMLTLVLYVVVYTPLKRCTSFCTTIGAIPGAMPPILGWTAAGGTLNTASFSIFAIMFLWQFPHFLAIAWLYRHQYHQAGLKMLPAADPAPRMIGWMCVIYATLLIPVSLLPQYVSLAGSVYSAVALVLGIAYLIFSVRFLKDETRQTARELIWCSLIYLPVLLITLTWDRLQLFN